MLSALVFQRCEDRCHGSSQKRDKFRVHEVIIVGDVEDVDRRIGDGGAMVACEAGLERIPKKLNHLSLPEIEDFNALDDKAWLRYSE